MNRLYKLVGALIVGAPLYAMEQPRAYDKLREIGQLADAASQLTGYAHDSRASGSTAYLTNCFTALQNLQDQKEALAATLPDQNIKLKHAFSRRVTPALDRAQEAIQTYFLQAAEAIKDMLGFAQFKQKVLELYLATRKTIEDSTLYAHFTQLDATLLGLFKDYMAIRNAVLQIASQQLRDYIFNEIEPIHNRLDTIADMIQTNQLK